MLLHNLTRSHLTASAILLLALALLSAYLPGQSAPAWALTGTSTFDTVAQFSASCTGGSTLSNTSITEDGNGEISLQATLEDYFRYSGAPAGATWEQRIHSAPETPTFNVDGSALTITTTPMQTVSTGRGSIRSLDPRTYGVLEGLVTFSDGDFQQFGFTDPAFEKYATFSTRDRSGLYAVAANGPETSQQLLPAIPTTPQRLRIEWSSSFIFGQDEVRYFLNGSTVPSATLQVAAFPADMRIRLSNNSMIAGNLPLRADWIRYTPYLATSGTYTSCPIVPNASKKMSWGTLSWNETLPIDTAISVELRTANTLAGLSAASFALVTNGSTPAVDPGVYAQYRATLTRPAGNNLVTPRLNAISLAYASYDLPDQITPASGRFGTQFLAQGDDFTANTALIVSIDGQAQGSPALSSNAFGEFYLYIDSTVATIGAHSVTISETGGKTLTLPFTVASGGSPVTPAPPAGEPTPPTFALPPPSLSIDDASVAEGDSGTVAMSFPVRLSAPSGQTVTVNYATQNGTPNPAQAPSDYTAILSTPLSFPPGTTVQTITVLVNGDLTVEQNETLFVNLSGANNATIADAQSLGTITNDDGAVFSIGNTSVTEGDSGTSNLVFTVSLSAPSVLTTTVDYATANGTAQEPSDYTAIPATQLVLSPGTTTQTITVQIKGEALYENNETVLVNLTNPSNATIADSQGVGIIVNDDTTPTIAIGDASVAEGNSGTSNLVFTVGLSAPSGLPVSVSYATQNGTATAPADYTATPTTALDFPAGTTSQVVVVQVKGDTLFEDNETLLVNLSNAAGATIADAQGQGMIGNDDTMPTIAIGDASVAEGNSDTSNLVFTVSLSAPSSKPVTVNYATADGTAQAPGDYAAIASTPLTFPAGTTTQTITVQVKGDSNIEGDETLLVNLSGPSNATIADGQGQGTIVNDDQDQVEDGYTIYLPIVVR